MTKLFQTLLISLTLATGSMALPMVSYAKGVPDGFTELTKQLSPAVVNISTAQNVEVSDVVPLYPEGSPLEGFNDFFNPRYQFHGSANGFIC